MKPILFTLICFFLLNNSTIQAAKDPVKYGKIEKSLLEMKVYDKDTSADAIVVCDYGVFEANTFSFSRIFRLKVLKKTGCDRANFAFSVSQRSNIKGITYNLENGEIVETKLKSESVFEEDIDRKYFRYKVTMPNVQIGSVIDIKVYFSGIPSTWYFQSDIPVVWSELRLGSRPEVDIQKNFFGFQSFSIAETDRWVCKDVPALKKEPHMNNLDNYFTKFELEFSRISIPGYFLDLATTWDAVNSYLLDKSTVGRELKTVFFMGDEVKYINENYKTQKEKLYAAYETIKKKIKWNNVEYLYPRSNSSVRNVLNKGAGNSGEVNIALLLLLKKLDFECYPVALSTRDNGLLSIIFPTIDKLNYLIVQVKINGENILLDATDEYLPAGLLPERCINSIGRIVSEKNTNWVDLLSGGIDKKKMTSNIRLDENGVFLGDSKAVYYDYAAYLFRKDYSEYNDKKEYVKQNERENPGLKYVETSITPVDSIYKPIVVSQTFEYTENIDIDDSSISFLPVIFDRMVANPFKNDVRKFPVDYIYPIDYSCVYNYQIPVGYKISELPKNIKLMLPNNSGKFIYRIASTDSIVSVFYNFNISKTIFSQNEYQNIKDWYAEIIKKESEPLVFKKSN